MLKYIILILNISLSTIVFSQSKKEKEVLIEGNKLYKSEMASWYGTDIFLERFPDKKDKFAGYISYTDQKKATCIFFTKGINPRVLVSITFDTTYNVQTASVDSVERDLIELEKDLYNLKTVASKVVMSDTLFKYYNNTSLNLIPLSGEKGKRVYVVTGPKANGVVLFGNDYLITFDKEVNVKSTSKLHKSLIPINYKDKDGKEIISSIHSHLPEFSDYITATDICTLRLYEKFATWQNHIVISEKYVSIWDCTKDALVVLTHKAWDKIKFSETILK